MKDKKIGEFMFAAGTAEMIHRTGVHVHDDFPYIKNKKGEEFVFLDGREFEIQRKISLKKGSKIIFEKQEDYFDKVYKKIAKINKQKKKSKKDKEYLKLNIWEKTILQILNDKKINEFYVSESLNAKWFNFLKQNKFKIYFKDFSLERRKKTKVELKNIINAQAKTEKAFGFVKTILEASKIENNKVVWEGKVLTSEILKYEIKKFLLSLNAECDAGIIVATGKSQTSVAHDYGSGDIIPNEFIIVDIFPKDLDSGYYGDMTRTFIKGKANDAQIKLYNEVKMVQEKVLENCKVGVKAKELFEITKNEFEKLGHKTQAENGFTHGLGHSLGLLLHEYLPVAGRSASDELMLEMGDVLTIEPGLYYEKLGGVRIEDIIYVDYDGKVKNMNTFEKILEIN
jgi:Xaa-Pro aminopeptidase